MILESLFGRRASAPDYAAGDPTHDYWFSRIGRKTRSEVLVNEDIALTLAACWCATRVIAETTAGLPLITYERDGDDREQATTFPLYDILKSEPNPTMGSMAWRERATAHQVNWGNSFDEIERADPRDPGSEVVALWPIHPSRVRVPMPTDRMGKMGERLPENIRYIVRNDDGSEIAMRADEMLHVPGVLSEDGIWGKGVIQYARETIGEGIASAQHQASSLGRGNMPRAVAFIHGLKDADARREFRKNWRDIHAGPNGENIALLGGQDKIEALGFTNEQMQWIEGRRFNKGEIATWYRLPPHTIGDLTRSTFSNIEVQGAELVIYGLYPWTRRREEQIHLKLLTREQRGRFFVEHLWQSLLRGDIATRFGAYVQAVTHGFMTINQVRQLENWNGIGPAGDQHFVPLNMTTAEKMFTDANPSRVSAAVPAALPAPAPEPSEAAMGEVADSTALRGAARAVLVDVLRRMGTRESQNCRAVIEKRGDFDVWLSEFWPKHEEILASNLTPACQLLTCCGLTDGAALIAGRLCAEALTDLRAAYDTHSREQFLAMLDLWPTERAARKADEILARLGPLPAAGKPRLRVVSEEWVRDELNLIRGKVTKEEVA